MNDASLQHLVGKDIVLDTSSPYLYIGTLEAANDAYLTLTGVDVSDMRDTATTRDVYVIESLRNGVKRNRERAIVFRKDICSISLLSEVVKF